MAGTAAVRPGSLLLLLVLYTAPKPLAAAEPEPAAIREAREIHPPSDVTWTSTDMNHSLTWRPAEDAGTGTTYTVECRLGSRSWESVVGCENITAHVCLMNQATDFMGGWTARVSAHDQEQSSDWAVSQEFRPAKDSNLSTPHLGLGNMEVGVDEITVTFKLPITPFDPEGHPWHYYNAMYSLTWWKKGDNYTDTTTGKVVETTLTVAGLHQATTYCLTAMWSIRVPPDRHSDNSKPVCVTTKERIPSEGPRNISLKPLPINCMSPSVRDVIISWTNSEIAASVKPYEVKTYDVKWNDHGNPGDRGSMAMTVNATDRSLKITCLGSVEAEVRACNTAGCGPAIRGVLKFSGGEHLECRAWTSVAVVIACLIGLGLLVGVIMCCRKTHTLSKEQRAKKSKLPSILEEVVKGSGDGSYWPVSDRPRPEVYDVVPTPDELSKLTDTSSEGSNSTSEEVFTPGTPPFSDVSFRPVQGASGGEQQTAQQDQQTKDERYKVIWDLPMGMGNRRPHHDSSSTYVSSITDTTSYTSELDSPQPEKAAKVAPWSGSGNAGSDNSYVPQSQLSQLQPAPLIVALPEPPNNSNDSNGAPAAQEKQDFRKYSGPKSPSKMTADQFHAKSKKMPKCAPKTLSEEISDYVSVG
ncbi:PREDICTED: uncharacterized protein LOC109477896 [Branchiostoma belcheri]|uniref:Uncharacterized protein LOC109477896 n=1 Tax=Branchiostoma belcheri TaxID=7741 RepID=A0A6P4Z034_BRABE|nr:PREDICTED: uncharacterized protein LOC109477896 [Branchiostoma belcheri]